MRRIRCFLRASEGVAAVEFALVIPMLLVLFLGGFEMSRFLLLHQKTEKVAYTVADVVAQSTSVTQADLARILTAAGQVMQPFTFGDGGLVIISSVYQSGTAAPTVRWQYTGGGTLTRTSRIGVVSGTATLPGNLTLNDRDNIIIAEVFYRYSPSFTGESVAAQDLYKVTVFKPRLGALTTAPN